MPHKRDQSPKASKSSRTQMVRGKASQGAKRPQRETRMNTIPLKGVRAAPMGGELSKGDDLNTTFMKSKKRITEGGNRPHNQESELPPTKLGK